MIKKTIQYKNFLDEEKVATLRFTITKARLLKNLHLKEELEMMQRLLEGGERELSMAESQRILNLVEEFIRLSYGELGEDGEHFDQSPEVYERFKQTKAYEAFLLSLFEDPSASMQFMVDVLPSDLTSDAQKRIKEGTVQLPGNPQFTGIKEEAPVAPPEEPENRGPVGAQSLTIEEMMAMSDEEFDSRFGTDPQAWSRTVMNAAYRRKTEK